jgi:hypothetical protein
MRPREGENSTTKVDYEIRVRDLRLRFDSSAGNDAIAACEAPARTAAEGLGRDREDPGTRCAAVDNFIATKTEAVVHDPKMTRAAAGAAAGRLPRRSMFGSAGNRRHSATLAANSASDCSNRPATPSLVKTSVSTSGGIPIAVTVQAAD